MLNLHLKQATDIFVIINMFQILNGTYTKNYVLICEIQI